MTEGNGHGPMTDGTADRPKPRRATSAQSKANKARLAAERARTEAGEAGSDTETLPPGAAAADADRRVAGSPSVPTQVLPAGHRSGFVAVVGRPNVGKSTLVNKLVGQKIAITSDKPQTTRHALRGVVTREDAQIVFVDTPGIHKPLHLLGEQIVKAATDTLDEVDVRVLVVDCQELAGKGDQFIAELLKRSNKPTVLVLNKADRLQYIPERNFQSYKALADFDAVVPLSARTGRNLKALIEEIVSRLPEGPRYYDEDVPTDQTLRTLAGELIREQVLRQTSEEIPHSVAVLVESFDESRLPVHIGATIVVERKSQKGIIIGEGGSRLKSVGQAAREQIEKQVGQKVYLELWVKVMENWRKDRADLKRLGYVVD